MKLTPKHTVSAIILVLHFATPVVAGPLEDADAAIKRRDYATAVRLIRPLAEQGDANAQRRGIGGKVSSSLPTSERTKRKSCRNSKLREVELFYVDSKARGSWTSVQPPDDHRKP